MNALKIVSCIGVFLLLLTNFASYASTTTTTLESELLNACKAGDLAIVQKLIKKPGIDVNKGDEYGCTPVIIASQERDIWILEVLLSLKKSDGSFAINVNQSNMDGITPLLAACQNGHYQTVEKLLAVPGIDVNQADNNGETPLLVACKNNRCNLNLNIIDALLRNGAVNKANKKGETPLEITKDTNLYGQLEFYLVGEVHESRFCSALPAEFCSALRAEQCKSVGRR
jgi:ankyrin repeat protein